MTKSICVFCGSMILLENYTKAAKELGQAIVNQGYGLVYGGGNVGLMKILADSVKNAGGKVIGVVIPEVKTPDVDKQGITIIEKETYSQRIAKMMELSVGFVALPGGIGTLRELIEVIHNQSTNYQNTLLKPLVLLNIDRFYNRFAGQITLCEEDTFIKKHIANMVYFTESRETPEDAVRRIASFKSPKADFSIRQKKLGEEKIALQNKPRPWLTSTTLLAGAGALLVGAGVFALKKLSSKRTVSINNSHGFSR